MLTKNSNAFTIECDNYVSFSFKEKKYGSTIELSVGHASLKDVRESLDAIESKMSVEDYCDFLDVVSDIEDAMSYYSRDLYTSSYISMMQSLVDGYDGDKDKESGSPWCTSHFYDIEDPSFISDCAKKDALSDCEEIAGYIDDDTSYTDSVDTLMRISIVSVNKGMYDESFFSLATMGRDYEKKYAQAALECLKLEKENPSTYYVDIESQEDYEISLYDFFLESAWVDSDKDLYNGGSLLRFMITTKKGSYESGEWINENNQIETIDSNIRFNDFEIASYFDNFNVADFLDNLQTILNDRKIFD